jgi:hypothetical protein
MVKLLGVPPTHATDAAPMNFANHVPSYVSSTDLLNTYDVSRGIYNYKSSNTRRLDQGFSRAMANDICEHLVVGDSGSAGCVSANVVTIFDRLRAWPLAMRDQLSSQGIPGNGTGIIRTIDGTVASPFVDARWATTGTWSPHGWYAQTTVLSSTATCSPDRSGSICDIWYVDGSLGSFTVSVDGASTGTGFTTVAATGAVVVKRVRLSGLNIVGNASKVKINYSSSGTNGIKIIGISVWSPGAGFIIHNAGQSSATAGGSGISAWADFSAGPGIAFTDTAGTQRIITDAVATSTSSPNLNSATQAAFTSNDIGTPIDAIPNANGILFPPGCYIGAVNSATQAVIWQKTTVNGVTTDGPVNALITNTGQTVNIGRPPACIHIELGLNDLSGGRTTSQVVTDITSLRNHWPNSDCILHLVHEMNYSFISQAVQQDFWVKMYQLADTLDVPLYDWRDRVGSYANGISNGVYGDVNVHLTGATYADIGASLAAVIGGGSGQQQTASAPITDVALTNKAYTDFVSLETINVMAPSVSGVNGYETLPRTLAPGIANQSGILTNNKIHHYPIALPKGFSVGHITFISGATAASLPTHWWFGIYDSAFVQLAVTADQAGAAWAANTAKTLAIATTAQGAQTSFVTKYAGLYYVSIAASATTAVPTLLGLAAPNATIAAVGNAILAGAGEASTAGPYAFPKTTTAPASAGALAYAYITN